MGFIQSIQNHHTNYNEKGPSLQQSAVPMPSVVPIAASRTSAQPSKVAYLPTRHERNLISANCLALLKFHLGTFPLPKSLGKGQETLLRAVRQIQNMICHTPLLHTRSDHREKIQQRVCQALHDSAYQNNKTDHTHPCILFLQIAADIIHNHAEGMSVYETLGERLLQGAPEQAQYTCKDLGSMMELARRKAASVHCDSRMAKAAHIIRHPWRGIGSLISVSSKGLQYNAYNLGNHNAHLGTWVVGRGRFHTSAGPNPTHQDYSIFNATLQLRENMQCPHVTHTQGILEGAERHKGPQQRRNRMLEKAAKPNSPLHAFALPMDGPAHSGKGRFASVRSAKDFAQQVRDHEALVLPEKSMSYSAFAKAQERFQNACSHLEGTSAWESLVHSKQLSGTLLLGFNVILALSQLADAAQRGLAGAAQLGNYSVCSTYQITCKQGIDRGVIVNMLMRILVDAKNRGTFDGISLQELRQYCGYTFGRARNVDARQILEERYKCLRNFLRLVIAASPNAQKAFLDALDLPQDMRFIPSNEK